MYLKNDKILKKQILNEFSLQGHAFILLSTSADSTTARESLILEKRLHLSVKWFKKHC